MTTTYDSIASTTLGSTATYYDFTSISQTYTDLVIVVSGTTNSATNVWLQFNSDTGSNYSYINLFGQPNNSTGSYEGIDQTVAYCGNIGTVISPTEININNYTSTNTFKSVLTRSNVANDYVLEYVNLWRSTAAITSIRVGSGQTYQIGTTFALYGIKAE
jgi:hypothetical protein